MRLIFVSVRRPLPVVQSTGSGCRASVAAVQGSLAEGCRPWNALASVAVAHKL